MKFKYLYSYNVLKDCDILWSIGTVKNGFAYGPKTIYLNYYPEIHFNIEVPKDGGSYIGYEFNSEEYKKECMRLKI